MASLRAVGLVIAFCWAAPALARTYPVTARMNVAYGPAGEQIGDFYIPAGPAGPKPAVIMIHGGGWVSGSRGIVGKLGEILAAAGVVVFNIDYRLAKPGQADTRWPAQIADAQLAVRFMRSHAAEFDIDPAHIGAMGDSSGGQMAVLLGELRTIVPADMAKLLRDQRPDVSVVVDEYGPTDIPGMGADVVGNMKLLFGTATPDKAMVDSASPLSFVTAQTAPTYIIHGRQDRVVPFAQSQRLADALQAHQVPHEFVAFDGGHGYAGLDVQKVGALQVAAFAWLLQWLR